MTKVVARAVERYRRQHILEEANAQYAALLADPAERAAFRAEFDELDRVFHTDLQDDPW